MSVAIIDTLSRGGSGAGTFPVAKQEDLRIPYISVTDLTARNAIPAWQRIAFMTCYVVSTNLEYTLGSDISISGQVWTQKSYGVPANVVTTPMIFDSNGFIQAALIQNIFLNQQYVVPSQAAMLALTTFVGNFVIRTDTSQVFIKLNGTNPASLSDFAIATSPGAVLSVNGQTGVVSVTIANLLAVTQNTTDFNTAVGNAPAVTNNASAISTLQSSLITTNTNVSNLSTYSSTHIGSVNLSTLGQNPTLSEHLKVLTWNNTTLQYELRTVPTGPSGPTTFLGLSDVPSTYTGNTLKVVRVNAAETALEFATASPTLVNGSGLTFSTNHYNLGGTLTQNTLIDGVFNLQIGTAPGVTALNDFTVYSQTQIQYGVNNGGSTSTNYYSSIAFVEQVYTHSDGRQYKFHAGTDTQPYSSLGGGNNSVSVGGDGFAGSGRGLFIWTGTTGSGPILRATISEAGVFKFLPAVAPVVGQVITATNVDGTWTWQTPPYWPLGGSAVLTSDVTLTGSNKTIFFNSGATGTGTLFINANYTSGGLGVLSADGRIVNLGGNVTATQLSANPTSHIFFTGTTTFGANNGKHIVLNIGTAYQALNGGFTGTTLVGINYNPFSITAANHYAAVFGSGLVGIGTLTPTATLHLGAGTTTNGPLKLTSGSLVTTITGSVQDGLIEYNGTHLSVVIGSTRFQLDQQSGGGITNTAINNEIPKSNGTNIIPSGIFSTSSGNFTTGVWQATVVDGLYGGTGVANSGKTITLGGNLTTSGAFNITFTVTGSNTITFPNVSITVARIDAAQTFTGIQTFSSIPVFSAGIGSATATTQTAGDNSTKVATTAYVDGLTLPSFDTTHDGYTLQSGGTGRLLLGDNTWLTIGSTGAQLRSNGTVPIWSTTIWTNAATIGDILQATSSNTYTNLTAVATGNVLISGGVATANSWGKVGLTTHVTGDLPVTNLNGGTSASSTTFWRGDGVWAVPAGGGSGWPFTGTGTFTGAVTIDQTTTSGNILKFLTPTLNVTPIEGKGIWIANNTAAAAGAQQISGSVLWEGQGWATTPVTTRTVRVAQYLVPVQGAANPTGTFYWDQSVNGAAYAHVMSLAGLGGANPTLTLGDAAGSHFDFDPVSGTFGSSVQLSIKTLGLNRIVISTNGNFTFSQTVQTSGSPTAYTFNTAAHTTLALNVEALAVNFNTSAIVQYATGAQSILRNILIQAPTIAFVGASTITDNATFTISGAPKAGTNTTQTNAHGLLIQAGAVTSAGAAYGATINAPTGGTTNYSAQFLGGIGVVFNQVAQSTTHTFINITQAAHTGGTPIALSISTGAHTSMTAGASYVGISLASTSTAQFASNTTVATAHAVQILNGGYSFASATGIITNASLLNILGSPISIANCNITNAHGILISSATAGAGTTNSYGITVNTMTTAANNYAAQFLGGNVGIGISAPVSTLDVLGSLGLKIRTITTSATAAVTDYTLLCDATGGVVAVTLPTASGATGRIYVVKKIDASANNVTLATTDGGTKTITTRYAGFMVQSDGSLWYVIASF